MTRYEGVRFSDGSVVLRRIADDPCENFTRFFDSVRACNEELGRREVITWLADAVPRREACPCCGRPGRSDGLIGLCDWCLNNCPLTEARAGVLRHNEPTEETDGAYRAGRALVRGLFRRRAR